MHSALSGTEDHNLQNLVYQLESKIRVLQELGMAQRDTLFYVRL